MDNVEESSNYFFTLLAAVAIRGELAWGDFEAAAEAGGEVLAGIEPVAKSNIGN